MAEIVGEERKPRRFKPGLAAKVNAEWARKKDVEPEEKESEAKPKSNQILWVCNSTKAFERHYSEIKDELTQYKIEQVGADRLHKVLKPEHALVIAEAKNFCGCKLDNGIGYNINEVVDLITHGTPIVLVSRDIDDIERWMKEAVMYVCPYQSLPEVIDAYLQWGKEESQE